MKFRLLDFARLLDEELYAHTERRGIRHVALAHRRRRSAAHRTGSRGSALHVLTREVGMGEIP